MAKPQIKVTGLNELVSGLRLVDSRLPRALGKSNKKVVDKVVVPEAQRRVPRGATGNLERSIKGSLTQKTAQVQMGSPTRVPYAGPINFGWPARNITAQESLYSAIAKTSDEIIEVYFDELDSLSSRAFPLGSL